MCRGDVLCVRVASSVKGLQDAKSGSKWAGDDDYRNFFQIFWLYPLPEFLAVFVHVHWPKLAIIRHWHVLGLQDVKEL